MWECNYANEPIDWKLLVIRFLNKIWVFIVAVLAGAILFGGCCFLKNVVFAPEKEYQSVGETYIEYVWEDAYGISRFYINEAAWNGLVKTDIVVEDIQTQLAEEGIALEKEQIRESVRAAIVHDSRIVTTYVTTQDPELSVLMGYALQTALINYGETQEGVEGTRIMTSPETAKQIVLDARLAQTTLLGAIAGGAIALVAMFLVFLLDDSVYVPSTFERRYKMPMLGALSSKELAENLKYLYKDCKNIALTPVETDIPIGEIVKELEEKLTEVSAEEKLSLCAVSCVLEEPGQVDELRNMDGVILAVASGRHDGKRIEKMLDFLKKQDCKVKGAILWNADERLLKWYYGFGIIGKKR